MSPSTATVPSVLQSDLPIMTAPMAGGPSRPELVNAAGAAGGIGFLAAGYLTVDTLAEQIGHINTDSFGVNLFVPDTTGFNETEFKVYAARIATQARDLGVEIDETSYRNSDQWDEKLSFLCEHPVPIVSCTFGLPDPRDIARLQRAGSIVLVTVTTVEEATAAEAAGADALVVQGPNAGGHSGTWNPRRAITPMTTADVVCAVRAVSSLPVIAAGGVDGAGTVQQLLASGAFAVSVGTLLLRTDEAGTSATHREALASPEFTETAITRAFTGRPARALRNAFMDLNQPYEITAYPEVHFLTAPLRKHAGTLGDMQSLHLWAGTGFRNAQTGPLAETFKHLTQNA